MADEDDVKKQEDPEQIQEDPKQEQDVEKTAGSGEKGSKVGILPWIILIVVVAVCAGAGFGLGRLLATPDTPQTNESSQEAKPDTIEYLKSDGDSATDSQKSWYYDLEPVVANLDEPGVTRYVRASLTLEMSSNVDKVKGTAFLEEKKPVLANWLAIYLASLNIEDCRSDRKLKSIQSQILDAFNEKLFPGAKPQVKHVLFREFAVQ
jgi:flagellar basal body-associated protein FliL